MKKCTALLLSLLLALALPARADTPAEPHPLDASLSASSALLMEKTTGQILYAQNERQRLEPASVTKVMTLLLVFEALDSGALSLESRLAASARAASMGGSQIFLKENETMSVRDLIKAVAVVSANDAAVALAEGIAGSEEAFVRKMNLRAQELGMTDTTFVNCTGLPADGHLTSARDIALMSRELIQNHPQIRDYTTLWMDSLRDGQFTLANTNKLVRFYEGATGLKTGYTASAHYCLSASAQREDMELIAVVLGCPTSQERFEDAKVLLNYGFASYALVTPTLPQAIPPLSVTLGEHETVQPVLAGETGILVEKSAVSSLTTRLELPSSIAAPVTTGQELGSVVVELNGEVLARLPLTADKDVPRLTLFGIFQKLSKSFFLAQ